jgi:hypothetical protein
MTTIKTTCSGCGDVELTPAQVMLYTGDADQSYEFTCPHCHAPVRKSADDHIVRLLTSAGVPIAEPQAHPETEGPELPPLTHDDLLAFHELLQSDDWFERVCGFDPDAG